MKHSKLPLARSTQFLLSRIGRHVGIALWSGMIVPPAASLILLATTVFFSNWPGWGDPASAVPSFLVLFFIFAVPVGYVFGGIPALLAGAIYSAALTAMPVLNARRLLRVGLGAVCGGLTGGIWFHAIAGPGSSSYAIVEALMMALFAGLRGPANDLAGFPSSSCSMQHAVLKRS
jgi:hypothetical protein